MAHVWAFWQNPPAWRTPAKSPISAAGEPGCDPETDHGRSGLRCDDRCRNDTIGNRDEARMARRRAHAPGDFPGSCRDGAGNAVTRSSRPSPGVPRMTHATEIAAAVASGRMRASDVMTAC